MLAQYAFLATRSLLSALGTISTNSFPILTILLNNLRQYYEREYSQGVTQALTMDTFNKLQASEKERLLVCFLNVDGSTVHPMKQLVTTVSNILRGQGTFDGIIATEIAISSKNMRKNIIDIDN